MTPLQRHRLVFRILEPVVALFARIRFNYTYESLRHVQEPFLLLPTHNLELDPIIVGAAAGRHLYFVASEHLSRKGIVTKLLTYFLQPIYHQKGRAGAHTVKAILKTLRSGTSVCLFPEGNRSFNGLTCPIPPATGKMARRSGASLVTYAFDGQYLTHPRWALTIRRGKLRGRIVHVYSPEELQAMTDDEVNAAIVRDLQIDAYAQQEREMIPYRGKKLALGMESTIFVCPKCKKIGTLHSDDDHLFCSCGFRAKYNVYGYLTDTEDCRFTVTELDHLQRIHLQSLLECTADAPLFSDSILLQEISDDHILISETSGTITAYADRLEICGHAVPYTDMLGMTIYSRNVLVFHTISDGRHFEIRGEKMFSALKYLYTYQLVKNEL